jgi:hypothetical protein
MILNMSDWIRKGKEYRKMKPIMWELVEHFSPGENWGVPDEIVVKLVFLLDALRAYIDRPIHLNNAFELSGHLEGSQHYLGRAADISARGMGCWDLGWAAMQLPFTGLVIYPHWITPGIHVDVRELGYGKPRKLMWRDNKRQYWNIKSLEEWEHLRKIYEN